MNKKDIINIIKKDAWMMSVLKCVSELNLPDWWIGAGFVRSKVWDYLHQYKNRTPLPDIDVIYLDKEDFSKDEENLESTLKEIEYQNILKLKMPEINWSVTNQARMHTFHGDLPYKNSEEALAQWVETATCIGVKLDLEDKIVLTAPRGIGDLVNLVLRQTPRKQMDAELFLNRINKKEWLTKWPKLRIKSS